MLRKLSKIYPQTKTPRKLIIYKALRLLVAERTGLEPATSAVTGQHSNQLNYRSLNTTLKSIIMFFKGRQR